MKGKEVGIVITQRQDQELLGDLGVIPYWKALNEVEFQLYDTQTNSY